MKRIFVTLFTFFIYAASFAQLKTANIFTDNMVLQRGHEINIWGWGKAGASVQVLLGDVKTQTKVSEEGKWLVALPKQKAGGPFNVEISSGKERISFENVMIGDVWIASGQSNMEWVVNNVKNAEEEIQASNISLIRHFKVERDVAFSPEKDIKKSEWKVTSPETVGHFTAVGYFFAKSIYEELQVPIGILHTSWGGTKVESWIDSQAMMSVPFYQEEVAVLQKSSVAEKAEYIKAKYIEKFGVHNSDTQPAKPQKMNMPSHWEWSGLYGWDGEVWYKTTFETQEGVEPSDAVLSLGKIGHSDEVWINGKKVGNTKDDPETVRAYKIAASALKEGKNELLVKVTETNAVNGGFLSAAKDIFIEMNGKNTMLAGKPWEVQLGEGTVNFETSPSLIPSLLYNAMVDPIISYPSKGFIWYQGESNADKAKQYQTLFPTLITSWREKWQQPDMPFLFVQLANFQPKDEEPPAQSGWAELREAQTKTLSLPNTRMAVTIDIGETHDIHPRNKQDVGKRLALAGLKIAYDKKLVHAGPMYEKMEIKGGKISIKFDNPKSRLLVKGQELKGFAIAGEDKKFKWAKAVVVGKNEVAVSHPDIQSPVVVRYAWGNNPDCNLYNQEELPAVPFRTDDW
ncbi:sialate O-acetylesterase [Flammeovirgaceae bacterium SG7u.111]|nr:sialate O-acetylesterase [Flammeovirgaceae bacterium SG7u.132]WPO38408.1 sialate O-acetylesterase [Flammeovirgaceae bacterium SG7u.111]